MYSITTPYNPNPNPAPTPTPTPTPSPSPNPDPNQVDAVAAAILAGGVRPGVHHAHPQSYTQHAAHRRGARQLPRLASLGRRLSRSSRSCMVHRSRPRPCSRRQTMPPRRPSSAPRSQICLAAPGGGLRRRACLRRGSRRPRGERAEAEPNATLSPHVTASICIFFSFDRPKTSTGIVPKSCHARG